MRAPRRPRRDPLHLSAHEQDPAQVVHVADLKACRLTKTQPCEGSQGRRAPGHRHPYSGRRRTARVAAGAGGLDTGATGRLLGHLLTYDELKVGRVAMTLGEAARGPARALVWELLAAALPTALTSGRRGVSELVTVAADAGAPVQARRVIDGLNAVAAGSSRLSIEARRLRAVLEG